MGSLTKLFWNSQTGDIDRRIYNVVGDDFTLNEGFEASSYYKSRETILEGIGTVYHKNVLPTWWISASRIPKRIEKVTLEEFIQNFTNILSEYIYSIWDPKIRHVMFHSSGWDSRILSSIILDLYKEFGDDWLGDIIFVCFGEEAQSFHKIMEIEGWRTDQYISFSKLNRKYLEDNLDFNLAWEVLNGSADYPVSNCYWAMFQLMERNLIPLSIKNTEMWSSSYFNEIFDSVRRRGNPISRFLKKYYYSRVVDFNSALLKPLVQPLLNFETIRYILQSKVKIPEDIRMRIVKQINPNISDIPRIVDTIVHIPTYMSDKLVREYKESWYGKKFKHKVRRCTDQIVSSSWWAHWSAASFCEHLRGR